MRAACSNSSSGSGPIEVIARSRWRHGRRASGGRTVAAGSSAGPVTTRLRGRARLRRPGAAPRRRPGAPGPRPPPRDRRRAARGRSRRPRPAGRTRHCRRTRRSRPGPRRVRSRRRPPVGATASATTGAATIGRSAATGGGADDRRRRRRAWPRRAPLERPRAPANCGLGRGLDEPVEELDVARRVHRQAQHCRASRAGRSRQAQQGLWPPRRRPSGRCRTWAWSRSSRTSASRTAPSRPAIQPSSSRRARVQAGSRSGANVRRSDRSRRVATRAWCTSSMSPPRRTPGSWRKRRATEPASEAWTTSAAGAAAPDRTGDHVGRVDAPAARARARPSGVGSGCAGTRRRAGARRARPAPPRRRPPSSTSSSRNRAARRRPRPPAPPTSTLTSSSAISASGFAVDVAELPAPAVGAESGDRHEAATREPARGPG